MTFSELHAQIEREREAERQAALALATQQGRIAGLQAALQMIAAPTGQPADPSCVPTKLAAPERSRVEQPQPVATAKPAPSKTKAASKGTGKGRPAADGLTRRQRQDKIAEVLRAHGPMSGAAIARITGVPQNSLDKIMRADPRFERDPETWLWRLAGASEQGKPAEPDAPKPKPTPKPKPVSENTRAYRRHKIAQTLSAGSLTLIEVARKVELSYEDALAICQDDPWFSQDPAGRWHITPQ